MRHGPTSDTGLRRYLHTPVVFFDDGITIAKSESFRLIAT
jgi:hypothetical protein